MAAARLPLSFVFIFSSLINFYLLNSKMIIIKDQSGKVVLQTNDSGVPPKGTTISDGQKTWSVLDVNWSISRSGGNPSLNANIVVIDIADATRGTQY